MRVARTLLFAAGGLSVVFALLHFNTRMSLEAQGALQAAHDLVGLSMIFAGLVTISVAWLALSPQILTGYSILVGIYYAGYGWILLFAGLNVLRAGGALLLALTAFVAAYLAWAGRRDED